MAVYDQWYRAERQGDGTSKKVRSSSYRRGKRWQVRWRDHAGEQCKQNFETRSAADSFDAQVKTQLDTGGYIDPKAGQVTLRGYAETWRKTQTHDLPTAERIERSLRLHVYPVIGRETVDSAPGPHLHR
jgi:hypothetical protein